MNIHQYSFRKKSLTCGNELYLLDTNIFLEVILSREYSKVIQDFLNRDITTALFVIYFSVFSVGIFLVRRNLSDKFGTFIEDLEMRDIRTISINANELKQIPHWCKKFDLDFDDAYQYAIADRFRLKLVSLDHDFDRSPKGRIHPKNL